MQTLHGQSCCYWSSPSGSLARCWRQRNGRRSSRRSWRSNRNYGVSNKPEQMNEAMTMFHPD